MDSSEARRRTIAALEVPNAQTRAWSPPERDRIEFLNEQRAELLGSLVEPYSVSVTPDSTAMAFGAWEPRPYVMFVVASTSGPDKTLLLLNSEDGQFSLGFVRGNDRIQVLGLASSDALAEWID